MEIAFSLGSNLDDRVAHLREAKRQLVAFADTTLLAQSSLYDTSPVDVAPEYADMHFVNAVLVLESDRSPQEWLGRLQAIEADIGRERDETDRNAPRTIDIDMLYAGDAHFDALSHRRKFPDGRVGSAPDLATPEHGQQLLAEAAHEAASDFLAFLEE